MVCRLRGELQRCCPAWVVLMDRAPRMTRKNVPWRRMCSSCASMTMTLGTYGALGSIYVSPAHACCGELPVTCMPANLSMNPRLTRDMLEISHGVVVRGLTSPLGREDDVHCSDET